jgi:phosphoglycolate phosphatase
MADDDVAAGIAAAGCILFDFDGTLAPNLDLPDLRRRVVALTRRRGVPDPAFEGLYIVEIIEAAARWLSERNPEAAASYHREGHDLITAFEVAAASHTQPFPEIPPMLRALRARHKRLGVVTRNCGSAVRTIFRDIDAYCDSVLTRDDVTHLKPDARHLQAALQALGQPDGPAVMVGDGALDMHVGRELGMICVGVLTGSGNAALLTDAGAHLVLPSAADLISCL